MNYEEKYKNALGWMRSLYDGLHGKTREEAECYFPELKESESERIRKGIKSILEHYKESGEVVCPYPFVSIDEALAWLEKQGEQKELNLVEILKHYPRETELYSPLYGKLWLAEVDEENEIITCYKHPLNKGCTRAILEQEDTVSFYSDGTIGLPGFSVSKDCMLFLYGIEKQGAQKPADKAEPKFHKGDWIIFNGLILHVDEIVDGYYRTTSIGGIPNSYDWAIDNAARLWTIQDAKDGDVLSYRDGQWIFIYEKYIDDSFHYYALYSPIYQDLTIDDAAFTLLNDAIVPATKEQRDLLFQKMKEAGYVWDADKKELRKIAQKPAWGEDDETGLTNTIIMLKEGASLHFIKKDITKAVDWLKSLKDRVQPQNRWKPTEEQMKALKEACDSQWELDGLDPLYTLYENLKKLI